MARDRLPDHVPGGSQFRQFRGWTEGQYWIVAAATAALFFASVLAHELSHAILARRFGLKVEDHAVHLRRRDVDRHGLANAAREALIAAAGPATSLLIGAVLVGIDVFVDQPQLGALVGWLGFVNIALGIFNLIPGFPMDGGRVLRASSGSCAATG